MAGVDAFSFLSSFFAFLGFFAGSAGLSAEAGIAGVAGSPADAGVAGVAPFLFSGFAAIMDVLMAAAIRAISSLFITSPL
jgi:hypothetical protein